MVTRYAGPLWILLLPASIAAQQIDTTAALAALRGAAAACRADGGALWGQSLCGPIAIVHRPTRLVIANDSVGIRFLRLGDAFVTTLPSNQFIANTSFTWAGRSWTMLAMPIPVDQYERVRLTMHEVFHREQASLGLTRPDALNNHLDFRTGRSWLRAEYRALAAALTADDQEARRHAENALLFRARRRAHYPGSDSLERALEMQEGLAEYTGHRFALRVTGARTDRVASHVRSVEAGSATFVRAFAYGTGPALGLLLDRFRPGWRTAVATQPDLGVLLATALGVRTPTNLDDVAAGRATDYGWPEIDREEAARDAAQTVARGEYEARFVNGPTITLVQSRDSLSWGYDPNTLVAFDLDHVVYPFGSFSAPWGALTVSEGGVLVRNDLGLIRIDLSSATPAPDSRELSGKGWTLRLNPGWSFTPDSARRGSYLVKPER